MTLDEAPLAALLALFGLIVGPWLAVVVDRAVERIRPAPEHRCVHCETGQGWGSLIPVKHWAQRCANCAKVKGLRYVTVDLTTALLFALLGLRFGTGWQLWPYLGLAAVLTVLSVIDIETHLLPNIVVWPSFWASLFLVLVISGSQGNSTAIYAALLGAAVFSGFLGIAHLINEQGMGFGDVKLGLLLGLFVGWLNTDLLSAVRLVFYAIFVALLAGGLVGLAINVVRRRRGTEIPFGPALAAASLVIILVSPALAFD